MTIDVPLGCSCGAVTGVLTGVTPKNSNRLSCMCDDCQVYAHFLRRAEAILDTNGGTDISYATQSRLQLMCGKEHLRAVKLTPKGIYRVYTACCKTPVAHVPSPRVAFVGIPHTFVKCEAQGLCRDQVLGPLVHRLQGRFCIGELPPGAHLSTPTYLQLKGTCRILWDTLWGMNTPSPFHAGPELTAVVNAQVLSPEEEAQLRERVPTPVIATETRFAKSCS